MLLKVLFCMYIIANGSWQENNAKLANKYAIFAQLQKNIIFALEKQVGIHLKIE